MRFSPALSTALTGHFIKKALKREKRFPLVLMLEPTHRCNLSCAGCDRVRLFADRGAADLSVEQCLDAAIESEAPVVTVTGGEPLLYEGLGRLLHELIGLRRHIYLCTNGLLAGPFLDRFTPHPHLTLSLHIDGMEKTHDRITGRPGSFARSMESLMKARARGFRVWTNTSVYKWTKPEELLDLFSLLTRLGVDGILVSPAFGYESVAEDIFLKKEEAAEKFVWLDTSARKFPLMGTPVYFDFIMGREDMECTPWGNPTRNPLGWKSPCYLITDGYYESFSELMHATRWDDYGPGRDARCANCMVHSGFEATVMRRSFSSMRTMLRMLRWNIQ